MEIYLSSNKRYGAPKIHKILESMGITVNIKRVQRRMIEMNIHSITVKRFRYLPRDNKSKNKNNNKKPMENIISQDFETNTINEKWCGDITYIKTRNIGWTYLASVMDMHTNKIIGYHYSKVMDTDTVIKALEKAIKNSSIQRRKTTKTIKTAKTTKTIKATKTIKTTNTVNTANTRKTAKTTKVIKPIILHTDRGSQYTSDKFNEFLRNNGIIHSYSRKGTPYDNAKIEAFHSIMKREEIYPNKDRYRTFEDAKIHIFEYIEGFYNRKRIHSSIGYLTPQEKEDIAIEAMRNKETREQKVKKPKEEKTVKTEGR